MRRGIAELSTIGRRESTGGTCGNAKWQGRAKAMSGAIRRKTVIDELRFDHLSFPAHLLAHLPSRRGQACVRIELDCRWVNVARGWIG